MLGTDGAEGRHRNVTMNHSLFCDERNLMNKLKLGSNFAVFLLFFGISILEAFQSHNWVKAMFWLAISGVFLYADSRVESH